MLSFKFDGISSNFENPIFSTLILTIVILIIILINVDSLSFSSVKYIFLGTLISTYFVLWNNYHFLSKKYYNEILKTHTNEIMSKVIQV